MSLRRLNFGTLLTLNIPVAVLKLKKRLERFLAR
jgi:hypothetical protein